MARYLLDDFYYNVLHAGFHLFDYLSCSHAIRFVFKIQRIYSMVVILGNDRIQDILRTLVWCWYGIVCFFGSPYSVALAQSEINVNEVSAAAA
jgi:hypothetical protein